MTKKEFIESYVVSFMANWAAVNYTDACMRRTQKALTDPGMFEEAVFLANELWQRLEHGVEVRTLEAFIPVEHRG